MSVVELKSKIGIEELIGELRQLDTPILDYLVSSLQQVQAEREQKIIDSEMTTEQFWQLIAQINWSQDTEEAILQPLVDALSQLPIQQINEFSDYLADLLHQLDGPGFIKSLEASELGFSADTFLYARCFAVAKGQNFYTNILAQNTPLPTQYLEQLLYVANKAYQQKTGKPYDYIPSTIYESFFNQALWGEAAIVL